MAGWLGSNQEAKLERGHQQTKKNLVMRCTVTVMAGSMILIVAGVITAAVLATRHKSEVVPEKGKFLWLSDFHYDPYYNGTL
jgi:hypothetical protein